MQIAYLYFSNQVMKEMWSRFGLILQLHGFNGYSTQHEKRLSHKKNSRFLNSDSRRFPRKQRIASLSKLLTASVTETQNV